MPAHWVIFTYMAWGHLRPECNLAVTLLRKFPELTISFIVDVDFESKAANEMRRNVKLGGDEEILSRIRMIPLPRALVGLTPEIYANIASVDPRTLPPTSSEEVERIHAAFDAMMEERAFTDQAGKTWEPIAKPNFMICDLMMGHVCPPLKEKYGLPLYMWFVGCATSLTRVYAPTELGGRGPTYVAECHAIEADPERSQGMAFSQITQQVWARSASFKDDIIRVKGLPPVYQWEDTLSKEWNPWVYDSIAAGHPLLQATDGVMLPTMVDIESEGVEGLKDWYVGTGNRKVLCLGPQLPSEYFAPMSSTATSNLAGSEVQYELTGVFQKAQMERDVCMTFLDKAIDKYGKHSAVYISFGSFFFPPLKHVEILLERLLAREPPTPFIFTASSQGASLSENLKKRIEESGKGLMVPWAPQQAILAHPALAAIVSHCGGGGTFESLSQGVPVIAWPCIADQATHALWMSEVLGTGFELLQVRDGPVKGKAYRGGPDGTEILGTDEAIAKEIDTVLEALAGEEGKKKRANAERVRQLIWDAHQAGAQIDQHLDLLKSFAGL